MRISASQEQALRSETARRFALPLDGEPVLRSTDIPNTWLYGMKQALKNRAGLHAATGAYFSEDLHATRALIAFNRNESGALLPLLWLRDPSTDPHIEHGMVSAEFARRADYGSLEEFEIDRELPSVRYIGGIAVRGPEHAAFFGYATAKLSTEHAQSLAGLASTMPKAGLYIADAADRSIIFASPAVAVPDLS